MMFLSFVCEDWLDIAEAALQRETALVDCGKELDSRRRDLKMIQCLMR